MGKVLFMRKGDKHDKPIALPAGYTKLAYIQSSGTQYIDTGFKPNQDTGVVLDCDFLTSNTGNDHHLASVNNTSQYFVIRSKSDLTGFQVRYSTDALAALSANSLYGRHRFIRDKNKASVDGGAEVVSTYSAFQITNTLPICCFKGNTGAVSGFSHLKVYSCQIYDNGTLVRDFVPCINESGEVGLYDLVGRKFYGNAGTGAFGAGDVVEYSLPEGYTELEYIESDGNQYVDTQFKPNQDTGVEVDFQLKNNNDWQCVFGARNTANNVGSYALWHSGTAFGFYFANANKTWSGLAGTARHTVVASKNTATANGTDSVSLTYSEFAASYTMFLFAANSAGAVQSKASMKLYSCRVKENDYFVRWYVPCITTSGDVGLYDVITQAFFGNAGTGTFIGSEVA